MTKINAIPTSYKGYRFRSRLEARWAVFLDRLEIKWNYEPEGFQLPRNGRYLPDFLIERDDASCNFWLEIKGAEPNQKEIDKALELSIIDRPVFMLCGSFDQPENIFNFFCLNGKCLDTRKLHSNQYSAIHKRSIPGNEEEFRHWPEFILSDRPQIGDLDKLLLFTKCYSSEAFSNFCTNYIGFFCSDAILAARSARFEFKEAAWA